MADDDLVITLKILSPSAEVEGGVTFPNLPASTTVKELRRRIQDAVTSKPAPERMRLIYRGRVVANDADTLGNIFGADTIRENQEQSLHLVLRELPSSASNSSSPAPPNPFRPAQAQAPVPASPLQTNPFRTIPQPQPSSQPQIPQPPPNLHHHHHHPHVYPNVHPHQQLPGPGNPFAIPVPQQLQQHFAQAMAQNVQAQAQAHAVAQAQAQAHAVAQAQAQAQAMAMAQPRAHTPGSQGQSSSGPTPPPTGLGPHAMPGRTVRQEDIGPNGERWSVTYNQVELPARSQHPMLPPHFVPPAFGLPTRPVGSPAPADGIDRLLPRLRSILDSARQEMQNVRTLFPEAQQGLAPANPPVWRVGRIQEHVQAMSRNLDLVERGIAAILADASQAQNADVVALRQSAHELRIRAEEMNRVLAHQQNTAPSTRSTSTTPSVGATRASSAAAALLSSRPLQEAASQPQVQSTTQTLPVDSPAELFILSSPQGPVGILFDQRGTYTTAPMVQTLPFQTFTSQFAQNRQLIAGLGQQMAHGTGQMQNQFANIQLAPNQAQQPAAGQTPNQPQNQAQEQPQNQNQNQNQIVNGNANPPGENDRMVNIAGHLWLIFKLGCFVYFFAGGGGLYRPIMLGTIALLVYLAQIGIFDNHFNLVRRHFEALLPVGALADRAAEPLHQRRRLVNLTPEQAAQRILQQRRDQRFGWVRESMRAVERSFALFVASLWPGIGERMVHAQEERLRLERVAEAEERERQDEARRQEAEAQQQNTEKTDEPEAEREVEVGTNGKGKDKADVTEGESSTSASTETS